MEIIQEIITYIIIATAVFLAARQLIRTFSPRKTGCSSCGTDCHGSPSAKRRGSSVV